MSVVSVVLFSTPFNECDDLHQRKCVFTPLGLFEHVGPQFLQTIFSSRVQSQSGTTLRLRSLLPGFNIVSTLQKRRNQRAAR